MNKRKKVACLVTGVPRGFAHCLPTLAHLLDDCEVEYHAVLRQEFMSAELEAQLGELLPGIKLIVVPPEESNWAVSLFEDEVLPSAPSLIWMWHEVWYAVQNMVDLDKFDYVFRTRFDARFSPQFLPDAPIPENVVLLPDRYNWSGSNDMLCLAAPAAFRKYANLFKHLPGIARRNRVAEHTVAQALHIEGLVERPLDVAFLIFRDGLHAALDDAALDVLPFTDMGRQIFKPERVARPAARDRVLCEIASVVDKERRFPVFDHPLMTHLSTAETDKRDGVMFRRINLHFYVRRALKGVSGIRFKIHDMVPGWTPKRMQVTVDGINVVMNVVSVDEYGRPTLYGAFDPLPSLQRPWSKIGIASGGSRPWRREKWAIWKPKRLVSVGIGLPEFEIITPPEPGKPANGEKVFQSFVAPVTIPLDRYKNGVLPALARMLSRIKSRRGA